MPMLTLLQRVVVGVLLLLRCAGVAPTAAAPEAPGNTGSLKPEAGSSGSLARRLHSTQPSIAPSDGEYYHPVGVTLTAGHGEIVYYTTDGTEPTTASCNVTSGQYITVAQTTQVRAASALDTDPASALSAVTAAQYTVYKEGRCGHAIFVPYHNHNGHSGQLVQLNLNTSAFEIVRLHNVFTDFADFYSDGGTGPYPNQRNTYNLAANDFDLEGFWGGFSARINGIPYGFLVPYFNGSKYHGKAVQIRLDLLKGANTMATLYCSDLATGSTADCVFKVLDLSTVDSELVGFSGGFVYGGRAYFVPYRTDWGAGTKFASVDAVTFDTTTVEFLDVTVATGDSGVGGFSGGFMVGAYAYLVPGRTYTGTVGGVNSKLAADGYLHYDYVTGTSDELDTSGGQLRAHFSGKLVRVDLSAAPTTPLASSPTSVLDLTAVDTDLRGFLGGASAGKYAYLAPYRFNETAAGYSSKLVRVDTDDFSVTGVTVADLAHVDADLRGFGGALAHGASLILPPYARGCPSAQRCKRTAQSSKAAIVDLNTAFVSVTAPGAVRVVDLAGAPRQQVPPNADDGLRGFLGGAVSGDHVVLSPHFNGDFHGRVARLDMKDAAALDARALTAAGGAAPRGNTGLQVLNVAHGGQDDNAGFSGAFTDLVGSCG